MLLIKTMKMIMCCARIQNNMKHVPEGFDCARIISQKFYYIKNIAFFIYTYNIIIMIIYYAANIYSSYFDKFLIRNEIFFYFFI